MPLNQSSQLCLWSFHYPWYFHIKHSRKADPKTIIWQSCDGRETEKYWMLHSFNKKRKCGLHWGSLWSVISWGKLLIRFWFQSKPNSQSGFRENATLNWHQSKKKKGAILGKHPAEAELGQIKKCFRANPIIYIWAHLCNSDRKLLLSASFSLRDRMTVALKLNHRFLLKMWKYFWDFWSIVDKHTPYIPYFPHYKKHFKLKSFNFLKNWQCAL